MGTLRPKQGMLALAVVALVVVGLAAAQALAAEPALDPLPTVSVPPVPVPELPVPPVQPVQPVPAPAVPPPAAPVAPAVPAPTVPVPVSAPKVSAPNVSAPAPPVRPPAAAEPAPVRPVLRATTPATAPSSAAAPASPSGPQAAERSEKQARPVRVTGRSWSAGSKRVRDRVVVGITFRLAKRQRVMLTVRGPAPSCRPLGTMAIRGVAGVNRFQFRGRLERKPLAAGVYHLTLTRDASGVAVIEPLLVQVVSPRRTVLLGRAKTPRSECDALSAVAHGDDEPQLAPVAPIGALPAPLGAPATPAPEDENSAVAPPPPEPESIVPDAEEGDEVLGVQVDLPALPRPGDAGPWAFAGALLLVGLPLLVMLALVIRFLRGSWDPQ